MFPVGNLAIEAIVARFGSKENRLGLSNDLNWETTLLLLRHLYMWTTNEWITVHFFPP